MITLWHVLQSDNQSDTISWYRRYFTHGGFLSLLFLGLLISCTAGQETEERNKGSTHSGKEQNDKASRTPAQRKISSELLDRIEGKRDRDTARQPSQPEPQPHDDVQEENSVLVDIQATVTDSLLEQIETLGGTILSSFPEYEAIRAEIPVEKLEILAESSAVVSIRAADIYQLHR